MSMILSAQTVFPKNKYTQGQIADLLMTLWPDHAKVTGRLHENTLVKSRHLALELEKYPSLTDFGMRNDLWIEHALPLAEQAATSVFESSGICAKDVDLIISTSITGIAVSSLEAKLMNRLDFRPNTKRLPVFGLGCLGGAASIARAHDYLKGHRNEVVLVLATELCSLTFQLDDHSMANIVATGLFADGASAVVMVGEDHPLAAKAKMRVKSSQSFFYPNTERTMGWDITGNGFKIVLAGDVPGIVEKHIPDGVAAFLDQQGKRLEQIDEIIAHPGGPKVLQALAKALGRDDKDLKHSWDSLAENGNMSSVSVLDILARTLATPTNKTKNGLLMAMGPAFCSEVVLTERIP